MVEYLSIWKIIATYYLFLNIFQYFCGYYCQTNKLEYMKSISCLQKGLFLFSDTFFSLASPLSWTGLLPLLMMAISNLNGFFINEIFRNEIFRKNMTIFFVSADFLIVSLDLIRKSVMLTLDLLKKSPFFTLDLNFSGFTVCPIVSRNVTGRVGLLPAQQQKMPFWNIQFG